MAASQVSSTVPRHMDQHMHAGAPAKARPSVPTLVPAPALCPPTINPCTFMLPKRPRQRRRLQELERTFQCQFCERKYASDSALNQHQWLKHGFRRQRSTPELSSSLDNEHGNSEDSPVLRRCSSEELHPKFKRQESVPPQPHVPSPLSGQPLQRPQLSAPVHLHAISQLIPSMHRPNPPPAPMDGLQHVLLTCAHLAEDSRTVQCKTPDQLKRELAQLVLLYGTVDRLAAARGLPMRPPQPDTRTRGHMA